MSDLSGWILYNLQAVPPFLSISLCNALKGKGGAMCSKNVESGRTDSLDIRGVLLHDISSTGCNMRSARGKKFCQVFIEGLFSGTEYNITKCAVTSYTDRNIRVRIPYSQTCSLTTRISWVLAENEQSRQLERRQQWITRLCSN